MTAASDLGTHFTHHISSSRLCADNTETRSAGHTAPTLVLAQHTSTPGITFDPIDDLLISVVTKSDYSTIVRDVGSGRLAFRESPGCIDIVPPGAASYWHYDGCPEVLHVSIPATLWSGVAVGAGVEIVSVFRHLSRNPIRDTIVRDLACRIWHHSGDLASDRAGSYANIAVEQLTIAMLTILIAEHYNEDQNRNKFSRRGNLPAWKMNRIQEIMAASLHKNITIESLAREVGLSSDYFQRAFASSTGQTPMRYLSEMRVEKAKKLLCEGGRRITDIAFELGYSSPGHFSNRFKSIVGMTPKQWQIEFGTSECVRPVS